MRSACVAGRRCARLLPLPAKPTHPSALGAPAAPILRLCSPQGTAVLTGHYSTQIGEGAHARLRRSGFAGISSRPPEEGPLDLEDFDALVFRCAPFL